MANQAYIGIPTEIPVYEVSTAETAITGDNIFNYFTVSNTGSCNFEWNGSAFVPSWYVESAATVNNEDAGVMPVIDVDSFDNAIISLTALSDMLLAFDYSYYINDVEMTDVALATISPYEVLITLYHASTGSTETLLSRNESFLTSSWSGNLKTGDKFTFQMTNGGGAENVYLKFYNMVGTATTKTQIGSETKDIAHKLTKSYIGIPTEIPVYETETINFVATEDTISNAFTVEYETIGEAGYVTWNGQVCTVGNGNSIFVHAALKLTALYDMNISFESDVNVETNADNYYMNVHVEYNSEDISNEVLGNGFWNASIKSGDVLYFWVDNVSELISLLELKISNITIFASTKTQVGTEIKDIAHRIIKAYIGIPTTQSDGTTKSVARLWWDTLLGDFEYIVNGDGTYTLTAWKGTLNGVPSTKIVIPDDSRIIL